MRPSLPLILIVLALLVSVIVGLILGGGPQVWFGERTGASGTNENSDLPLAPNTPHTPTAIASSTATRVTTATVTRTVLLPSATASPRPVPTAVAEPVESEAVPSETPPSEITESETAESEATESETTEVTEVRVTVVAIALRLRTIPDTEGEIVATLQNGVQGVAIQRDSQGWLEVEVNNLEVTGWLFGGSDFVTIEGDIETLPLLES